MKKRGENMSSTTFGEKIKIEGEREYRKALYQINSDLKVFSAEFGKNDTSTQNLTERNKVLTEQIEKQKDKIEILKNVVEKSTW